MERTVPFGFLAQTITIAWYALHGNPEATSTPTAPSPWYRHKATISYADMLAALRRELIRHEFGYKIPRDQQSKNHATPSPSASPPPEVTKLEAYG